MARVLFFLQLVVGLVVLPFWPGLDARFAGGGLVFLAVALAVPLGAAGAVFGRAGLVQAARDAWAVAPVGSAARRSEAVWRLIAGVAPWSGLLGGLLALIGVLSSVGWGAGPSGGAAVLQVPLFALVWGLLGALLSAVFRQTVRRLADLPVPGALASVAAVAVPFGLTPRETEVAATVLEGLTYRDAAARLGIAPATAKTHLLKVYEKTGAGNKLELLRMVEARAARLHQKVEGEIWPPGRD